MHLMMCDYIKFDIGVFFPFFQIKNKFLLSVYKSNDGEADFLTFVVCRDVLRTKQKQRSLLFLFW